MESVQIDRLNGSSFGASISVYCIYPTKVSNTRIRQVLNSDRLNQADLQRKAA
jgi:hypothetical protein